MPASPEEIRATVCPAAARCERRPAALDLLGHAGGDQLLAGGQVGDQLQVAAVADDDLALGDGLDGAERAVLLSARAYADGEKFSRAIATVTPLRWSWGVVIAFSFLPEGLPVRQPRAGPLSPERTPNARTPECVCAISSAATSRKGRPSSCAACRRPGSSALMSAEASSRTRAKSAPARARASRTAATIVCGRGPAPAADAHDQVLGGFGGRGDHRLGAEAIGHGQGQVVGARLRGRPTG